MTATLPTPDIHGPSKKPVDRPELSTRLLRSAAKQSYDPVVIDWAASIPTQLYGAVTGMVNALRHAAVASM